LLPLPAMDSWEDADESVTVLVQGKEQQLPLFGQCRLGDHGTLYFHVLGTRGMQGTPTLSIFDDLGPEAEPVFQSIASWLADGKKALDTSVPWLDSIYEVAEYYCMEPLLDDLDELLSADQEPLTLARPSWGGSGSGACTDRNKEQAAWEKLLVSMAPRDFINVEALEVAKWRGIDLGDPPLVRAARGVAATLAGSTPPVKFTRKRAVVVGEIFAFVGQRQLVAGEILVLWDVPRRARKWAHAVAQVCGLLPRAFPQAIVAVKSTSLEALEAVTPAALDRWRRETKGLGDLPRAVLVSNQRVQRALAAGPWPPL